MTLAYYVLFVFLILFSVGLHEFGHLLSAKKFGIKVEQYFIGFGPKLWSFRKGETEYGVKALPLGGFVRIAGMNPFEDIPPEDADRVFKAKKPWQRAIVLAAGSFTHFVLALFILAGIFMVGLPDPNHPTTTIATVSPSGPDDPAPARDAGIRPGDTVLSIDGHPVTTWDEEVKLIHERPGARASVRIRRDGVERTFDVTLARSKVDKTLGYLGVGPEAAVVTRGPISAFGEATVAIGRGITASLTGLKNLFSPSQIKRIVSQVQGRTERKSTDPATLVAISGQAVGLARSGDFVSFFSLIASFNIFIGVANLLPLPPLDGGHLAVLAYEKIRGRDVDMRKLIPLTVTVIGLFGSLFLVLLFLDISRGLPSFPG